jgi:hypothetical protein
MSTGEHKELVRRYYEELWNCWDIALADQLIAEGIAFRGSLGQTVRGREGFKAYVGEVRRALGIAPTGRRVSYAGVALFRIVSGQIAEGWVLGDLHGLIRQLEGET